MSMLDAGSLSLNYPSGTLSASGPDISILAGADVFDATDYPLNHCAFCRPGDVVDFSGSWLGTGGSVTYQGASFSTGGALDPLNVFSVTTPATVVPPLGDPFSLELPFTLDYSVGRPALDATGAGVATVNFAPGNFAGTWFTSSAVYNLDPPLTLTNPEPSTVFLLGTALLLGLFWRSRAQPNR